MILAEVNPSFIKSKGTNNHVNYTSIVKTFPFNMFRVLCLLSHVPIHCCASFIDKLSPRGELAI